MINRILGCEPEEEDYLISYEEILLHWIEELEKKGKPRRVARAGGDCLAKTVENAMIAESM